VTSCSPGFYLSVNDSQCLPCHSACLNCTSSSETACLTCKLTYVYLPDEHRCEKNTGQPFYFDEYKEENHWCHKSCAQCRGPNDNDCLACDMLTEVLLNDGHCAHQCPQGFYSNTTRSELIETNICLSCSTGCLKCSNQYQCEICDTSQGYTLRGSICIPTCSSG
jgi:proprotein convertase subtilisin/kexin type 5